MKTKNDRTLLLTTIICLLPIVLALIVYDRLPAQLAIHFDFAGKPDNYLPKNVAVFGLPAFMAAINWYSHFRLNNDPKNEMASTTLKQFTKWLIPIGSVIVIPITLFIAMGSPIPISIIATSMTGVIIVICGNYLPKCKRNYTLGIKLPWTLDNEDNWNKTHRFAGFVWVLGGILFTISAFFSFAYAMIGIVVLLMVLPPIYSYLTYKNQLIKAKIS